VNLHVWSEGDPEIDRYLRLRERLRRSPEDRARYEAVKRGLAEREWPDINHYAEAKSEVIETILAAEAFARGDWQAARRGYEAALERGETPEALLGLGQTLWWLGEIAESVRLRERAYAAFRRLPDPARAGHVAVYLCLTYRASLGNRAASAGWMGRAARLADEFGLIPLGGWVSLLRAGAGEDLQAGEELGRQALDVARRFADPDLELCALSQIGSILVRMGRVDEGIALLDEAMAGSLAGESRDPITVVFASCQMMASCDRAAEFERAGEWIRAADDFTRRYGCPFLYATCRVLYGSVLLSTGRWGRAEKELGAAIESSRPGHPLLHGQAVAKLAELRLAQGRVEEAERLVAGLEDHPPAAVAVAAIHLVRGRPAAAASALARRLERMDEETLDSAGPLELLVQAEIAQGATEAAAGRARRMAELGAGLGCAAIVARGERARARVLIAEGEGPAAGPHLQAALAVFARLEMPLEAGRTHLLLATAAAHEDEAIAEARAALAAFEELGAAADADAAASLLRSLGVRSARAGERGPNALTRRETEVLALLAEGLSNREIAERLFLTRKTVEHHVARVLSKLGLRSRAEAAAYAARGGAPDSATR
jgi:DNA-binding CsgD family transcriptional regulator